MLTYLSGESVKLCLSQEAALGFGFAGVNPFVISKILARRMTMSQLLDYFDNEECTPLWMWGIYK